MDTTYRSELAALNELNFAKFDAKLEQRVAELRAEFRDLRGELRAELREVKADLLKWMFVFVAGGTATILGVLLAILKQ
jgi:hypothetical protein